MAKQKGAVEVEQGYGYEESVDAPEAPAETKTAGTRQRKLAKSIEGTVVNIEVIGQGLTVHDFTELPADIQAKLGPFGLASKLGDAAAGREGSDAAEAIKKVWEGLVAGDWTVRSPAQAKVTISSIKENLAKLSDSERAAAEALLAGLGVRL